MFTGIVETTGTILEISSSGTNKIFLVGSPISHEFKVDQSVLHNGVCLTVEEVNDKKHRVTAIHETLEKTNLNEWKQGDKINLERSLTLNSRLDGHIVQGHVDTTAICIDIKELQGSREFTFEYPQNFLPLIIEKGSICINGVSLTAFNLTGNNFTVAIIPYTFAHTNFSDINKGSRVNIEFDVIGKYTQRMMKVGQIDNHAE